MVKPHSPNDASPLVTVIVVNWNGRKWLKRCLGSLVSQTYPSLEIILVDNNSSDDSLSYVKDAFPTVRVIRNNKNLGFGGGVNSGIPHAKGELILLINTDTWVKDDFVQRLVSERNAKGYEVISPIEGGYNNGDVRAPYSSRIDLLGHPVYTERREKMVPNFYLTGVCLLFSKRLYEETGGFDSNFFMYCEEVDWFWRLNLLDKRFGYSEDVVVYHKSGGSTEASPKVFLWRNQNTLQMLIKNYSLHNLAWTLPLYLSLNCIEILFFLIRLQPRLAFTYVQGWIFNTVKLRTILRQRASVQRMRRLKDAQIMQNMYKGSGKLKHLIVYKREVTAT